MKRTLTVKRERLTELAYTDLTSVVAAGAATPKCPTLPLEYCLGISQTSCDCCTASASC